MAQGDDDDDDDEYLDDVDVSNFQPPSLSTNYGLHRGRSPPSQRKAMGTSGSSSTIVHVCTNCGSEFVKWMGRCPTCRSWNTLQQFRVDRATETTTGSGRPSFLNGPKSPSSSSSPRSWLSGQKSFFENQPVRVTDVYRQVEQQQESKNTDGSNSRRQIRLQIPNDDEFNTVLGGGIMTGSLTLLGGDPGVGKSTLLLQTAGAVASLAGPTPGIGMGAPDPTGESLGPVWYVSGEENAQQIASRAARLGIQESELWLLSETHVDTLCEQVVAAYHPKPSRTKGFDEDDDNDNDSAAATHLRPKPPSLLIVDSIQTMVCDNAGASAAGGVTQVRESVAMFLRLAKSTNIPIFLVGHVTKSGDVAGPRTVEHMVDCVLYLEGGDSRTVSGVHLRMLRAAKNRFGSSEEVGVYEMTSGRLLPVSDPSSLFLSSRIDSEDSEGCAVALILEGLRAMTVEIQALVTPSQNEGGGRRTVDGISYSRLQLLLGVLQKRCGMHFRRQDVYINVVGNMRLDSKSQEGSASDLSVAVALVSSLLCIPVRSDTAFVGEIGLLGELRTIPFLEKRIQEARRMGFSRVITPSDGKKSGRKKSKYSGSAKKPGISGIDWIQCDTLLEAVNEGLVRSIPKRTRKRTPKGNFPKAPESLEELSLGDEDVIYDAEEEEIYEDDNGAFE